MSLTLLLVRHGRAEPGHGMPDGERRLLDEGVLELIQSCRGLAALGIRPERILTSPLVRTQETADILARELTVLSPTEPWPELASGAHADAMLAVLHHAGARGVVAMVGHMPDVGALVAYLVGGPERPFEPGGMALIEFVAEPRAGQGRLRWLKTPRELAQARP